MNTLLAGLIVQALVCLAAIAGVLASSRKHKRAASDCTQLRLDLEKEREAKADLEKRILEMRASRKKYFALYQELLLLAGMKGLKPEPFAARPAGHRLVSVRARD